MGMQDEQSKAMLCPLTGRLCEEGDCSRCSRFWGCLQNAIEARTDETLPKPEQHDGF